MYWGPLLTFIGYLIDWSLLCLSACMANDHNDPVTFRIQITTQTLDRAHLQSMAG